MAPELLKTVCLWICAKAFCFPERWYTMPTDYETDLCPTPKVKAIEHIFTKRTLGLPGDTGWHVVALLCVHACSTPSGWGTARPTNRLPSTVPFVLHALTSNTYVTVWRTSGKRGKVHNRKQETRWSCQLNHSLCGHDLTTLTFLHLHSGQ